jgi:hypothetical protein
VNSFFTNPAMTGSLRDSMLIQVTPLIVLFQLSIVIPS